MGCLDFPVQLSEPQKEMRELPQAKITDHLLTILRSNGHLHHLHPRHVLSTCNVPVTPVLSIPHPHDPGNNLTENGKEIVPSCAEEETEAPKRCTDLP